MFPNVYAASAAGLASFSFFLTGYDVTVLYGQSMIQKSFHAKIDHFEYSIKAITFVGVLVAGLWTNYVGRKPVLAAGAALYTVGAAVLSTGPGFMAYKAGRSFMGLGMGFGLVIAPVYTAEISPAHCRGFLGSLPPLLLCLGSLAGYTMQFAFSKVKSSLGWRLMTGLPAVTSAICFFCILRFLRESPCLLMNQGKVWSARTFLQDKLNTPAEEIKERMIQMKRAAGIPNGIEGDNVAGSDGAGIPNMWRRLFTAHTLGIVGFVSTLYVLQRLSGDSVVLSYVDLVLAQNNDASQGSYLVAKLMLTATKFSCSLLPLFLVDRWGRAVFLVISLSVVAAATAVLGTAEIVHQRGLVSGETAYLYYIIGGIGVEAGFGLGLGGVPWLYASEAFMLPTRALGVTLALMIGLGTDWIFDVRGARVYGNKYGDFSGGMLLLSTGLMLVGIGLCCIFMNNTARQVLTDAVVEQPQAPAIA